MRRNNKTSGYFGYFILLFLLLPEWTNAQYQPVDPLYREWTRQASGDSITAGLGYWPLDPLSSKNIAPADTPVQTGFFNGKKTRPMLWQYHSRELNMNIIPWVDFSYGKGNGGLTDHEDVRGLKVQGELDNKILFGASYYENNTRLPYWLNSIAQKDRFVPQEGLGVPLPNGSYDVAQSEAWLQYLCSSHFSIIAGYGRQFIGYGYRSVLVDDEASNYPYLRFDWHSGPWRYEVTYNQFLNPGVQIPYSYMSAASQRKNSVLHYLSIAIGKNIELGLFEHEVWIADDSFYNRGIELQYLNPVIFLHKVAYSLGDPDNDLMGGQATLKFGKNYRIYGQLLIDDFTVGESIANHTLNILQDKIAGQLGISKNKLLGYDGLSARLEWNTARPFVYGHRNVSMNYTQGDQPLADPLGANFDEFIFQLFYKGKKFYGSFEQLYALQGKDEPGFLSGQNLWGGEANVPIYGEYMLQGRKCTLSYTSFTLGYILNSANQLSVELSAIYRADKEAADALDPAISQNQFIVQLGVKSLFISRYQDY